MYDISYCCSFRRLLILEERGLQTAFAARRSLLLCFRAPPQQAINKRKTMKFATEIETKFAPAKRAADEVVSKQASQIEHVQYLDEMFSAVPNPVVILNKERQIVYANLAFKEIIQVADWHEILGMRLGEAIHCVHAFEVTGGCGTTEFCSQCGAVKAILKSQKGNANVQECRILADHEENIQALDLRVWATPAQFGNEMFTIFSMADISHEKRRRVLERIFFHDIINTAGVIQGLIDMFIVSEDPADLRELSIDTMLVQASTQLVDEIQAQSQLMAAESGELTVESAPFHTNELLQRLADMYRNHQVAEGRQIQLAEDSENVMLWSDRALLGRVVGNMIKNALEASSPGDAVTVGCEQYFDYVRFWVHNPKVMPRHIQLQVFQRSFSTKGNGRGLGTYSMKLLTESYLQGRISFESTLEKGTIFMATYPLEWREVNAPEVLPSHE